MNPSFGSPRARRLALAALSTTLALSGPARAQDPAPPARPAFQFLRQREDWSVLRDIAESERFPTDKFKYVPLSDDGEAWASFGLQTWARVESWRNFNFGAAPPGVPVDDTFLLWRIRLTGDFHLSDTWRVFIEGKSALATDRDLVGGKRPIDEDVAALQQLFVDIHLEPSDDSSLTLRPGRQMLQYGKQRLVSPLPWANALRSWDGVSMLYRQDAWAVDGFLTRFVPIDPTGFDDPDSGNAFYGVYASRAAKGGPTLDAYWLGLHNDEASFNGSAGAEDRQTFGARLGAGAKQGIDYDVESAVQVGTLGGDDILAGMLGAELGYRFSAGGTRPRVWLGFDYGSGDGDPDDGRSGTFNQLYPLGHAYNGFIDVIGRQNIMDVTLGASFEPVESLTLAIGNHAFWVPSTDDALYNAGGGVVRPGGVATSNHVGYEVDLTAHWRIDRHLEALFGYSHFFAGQFIEQTGPAEDIDFLYVSLQYTL